MAHGTNQWMLFGIDVRAIGHVWLSAWREFLFSYRSPLRMRLDEPVLLLSDSGETCFQGGRPQPESAFASRPVLRALELPEALVLSRSLSVPLAAESELASVLAMEVMTSSPFPPEDTVHGWEERRRTESAIEVALVIASRSRVNAWMRDQSPEYGVDSGSPVAADMAPEIWADVEGSKVCVRGFGEDARDRAYRQRLLRVGLTAAGVMVALLLSAALFAMQQRLVLGDLETLANSLSGEADEVSALRETLATANDTIRAFNEVAASYPSPHTELVRLTRLLGDQAFLTQFSMTGTELQVRGLAQDAATVMQTLADTERYAAVTAPQAIATMRNSGLEQFFLDIDLADDSAAGEEGVSP